MLLFKIFAFTMRLEHDCLNLARMILGHEGVSQSSKKRYKCSNKERQVCCSVASLRTKGKYFNILYLTRSQGCWYKTQEYSMRCKN